MTAAGFLLLRPVPQPDESFTAGARLGRGPVS